MIKNLKVNKNSIKRITLIIDLIIPVLLILLLGKEKPMLNLGTFSLVVIGRVIFILV